MFPLYRGGNGCVLYGKVSYSHERCCGFFHSTCVQNLGGMVSQKGNQAKPEGFMESDNEYLLNIYGK